MPYDEKDIQNLRKIIDENKRPQEEIVAEALSQLGITDAELIEGSEETVYQFLYKMHQLGQRDAVKASLLYFGMMVSKAEYERRLNLSISDKEEADLRKEARRVWLHAQRIKTGVHNN